MRPYSKVSKKKMILRDYLATDRTILANERTFLAYVRTSLTLLVAGASFVHFFNSFATQIAGWAFIISAIIMFAIGTIKYRKLKAIIRVKR